MKKILVILTTVALVGAFALTAAASDFNFYGSIRYNTISQDKTPPGSDYKEIPTGYTAQKSDRDMDWGLWGHSRVGANIKLSDEITGVFELGVAGDDTLKLRHYYAEYDFGTGKILIGQTWHPSSLLASFSSQIWGADDGLGSHGTFFAGRHEMIKLTFGNLQLALLETPNSDDIFDDNKERNTFGLVDLDSSNKGKIDIDRSLPQLVAAYSTSYQNLTLEGVAAFQTLEFTDLNNTDASNNARKQYGQSFDIDSNFFKFGAKVDLGCVTLAGSYGWGDNIGNMGISGYADASGYTPKAAYEHNQISNVYGVYDVETKGYSLIAGLKVNDNLSFETGYGCLEHEMNSPLKNTDSEAYSLYLQAQIKITDGFVLTPEIGKIDYQDTKVFLPKETTNASRTFSSGDISYFGAKWQINF